MAQTDRFIIAPQGDGLQTDVKAWLISDTAFSQLNNAYVFRGRVRRRVGSKYLNPSSTSIATQQTSRLRIHIANTNGAGNLPAGTIVPGAYTTAIGFAFSVNSGSLPEQFFTVKTDAAGAQPMLSTGVATGTFDSATGEVIINGAAITAAIYYYPSQPVMGFITYNTGNILDLPVYAFDTQFSYQYTTAGWDILGNVPPSSLASLPPGFTLANVGLWSGTDSQFFWGTTWRGVDNNDNILFVTNFKAFTPVDPADLTKSGWDGIKTWDGTNWTSLVPQYDATASHVILGARIIVPFKGYLVLLDTLEETGAAIGTTTTEYFNRARCCQNGNPFQADAWNQDIPGKGFFIDAPTKERISTAQFLKDHLIVYFEDSTWELVWSGNSVFPFYWQQLNTELGSQSTFSEIPFDQQVLGVGRVGVHACNGTNVARIDQKIPDEVFNIARTNDGPLRVCGIRDYFLEMCYWSWPDTRLQTPGSSDIYPNRILTYNYRNDTWAFNNDSVTAFGYFEQQNYLTWGTASMSWETANFEWVSPVENKFFKQIIAGNQEGYTFLVSSDVLDNASVLQITNLTSAAGVATFTVMNHNLKVNDYVAINNALGVGPVSQNLTNGVLIGTTDILTGDFTATVPTGAMGQQFSIGLTPTSEILTIVGTSGPMTSFNGTSVTHTFDTSTGFLNITAAEPGVGVYYYQNPAKFIAQVDSIVDYNTFQIDTDNFSLGTYKGNGTIERITPFDIYTKQYNFYTKQGKNCFVPKVDYFMTKTTDGECTIDFFTSSQTTQALNIAGGSTGTGCIVGTSVLETSPYALVPYEQLQERVWHPVYFQADGETVQFRFYLTDDQTRDAIISSSQFELHAMVIYAQPISRLQ